MFPISEEKGKKVINFVKESLNDALTTTNYTVGEMSALESVFFHKKVSEKFADGRDYDCLFWEAIGKRGGFSVCDENAWKWLDEFIQLDECLIFFDQTDDSTVYMFQENQSLTKFLTKLQGYVFYITNENLDFLIYFNDSDYLRCIGTAEPWLRNKVKELSKIGWVDMEGKSYL